MKLKIKFLASLITGVLPIVALLGYALQFNSHTASALWGSVAPIARDLRNGSKSQYYVDASSGHYFRLVIQPVDFKLKLALYDPNGRLCREGRASRYGSTSFSWIASISGNYRFEASLPDEIPEKGKLEIRLEEKRLAREEDKARLAAELAVSEAQLLDRPGTKRQALEKYKQALAMWRDLSDLREEATALNDTGILLINSDQYQLALDCFTRATPIWQSLADREGGREDYREALAESLYFIATIHTDWGNLRLAREYARKSLELLQPLNRLRALARTKTSLAVISLKLGDTQQALNLYREGLEINRQIHNSSGEVMSLNGLGYAYHDIGDDWNAIDSAGKALEIAEKISNLVYQMLAHKTIAEAYTRLGNTGQALNHATQGLEISRKLGDRRLEAISLKQLGAIQEVLGDKSKALELYERALILNRKKQNRQEIAATLNSIGFIHDSNGEKQKALAYYLEALPISREAENPAEEIRSLHNIARVLRDLGSLSDARDRIEQAINLIETLREQVGSRQLRESYFATVQKSYELYIDVLMLLHKQRPGHGLNEVALQVSEQARARSLREMLAESRADLHRDVPPQLLERERALQQDLNSKAARQQVLLSGTPQQEETEQLARDLRSLRLEYDEVQRQIRESAPHYAALTQAQAVTSKQIQQQLLDKDTALLEYALGDDRSYVWLVTSEKIISHELPSRTVIEKAARQAYELLVMRQTLEVSNPEKFEDRVMRVKKAEEQFRVEAKVLSQMILSPIASEIKQSRLVIVSNGALQYLPFGALPFPESARNHGNKRGRRPGRIVPLVNKCEVIYLPSASTLSELRKEIAERKTAPKTIAVIANPVFAPDDTRLSLAGRAGGRTSRSPVFAGTTLPSWKLDGIENEIPALPFSEREGSEIIKLAPKDSSLLAMGFDANRALLESNLLSQYRIIHFATHGLMYDEHPELSGLILSLYSQDGKKTDNGFLRMHEIYKLKLNADMVVLSACQTGIGKEIKGEGLVGLTRGFMYAGAPRVIASLWKVDDAATATLMEHFYRGLFQDKLSPSAALRQAQLKIMKQNQRWHSPYYWAAFVLQGEYR
jgi:CHAT domain-containing protein/tetratricopeptide (TPR) repeat protein